MLAYALRRTALTVPLLLGVVALAFLLTSAVPGDPVVFIMGDGAADPGTYTTLRERFGLDRPVSQRFLAYVRELGRGNLGYSLTQGRPVADAIAERLPATLLLAGAGAAVASLSGVLVGVVLAVLSRGAPRAERGVFLLVLAGTGLPPFVLGLVLILALSLWLGLLPSHGMTSPRGPGQGPGVAAHLVLPALTLGLQPLAAVARVTRARILEILPEAYIRTARAKGLPASAVVLRHALRNALPAPVALLALTAGHWAGGVVITETIFAWPGLGRLVVEATWARDYPLLVGTVLVATVAVVLANLAADLAVAALDPRVRYGHGSPGRRPYGRKPADRKSVV